MKVAIVGVGMMGGSLGMALRKSGASVTGIGRSADKLKKAVRLGACDRFSLDLSAARGADAVVICTVVNEIVPTFQSLFPFVGPETLVTDIGSVKSSILRDAGKALELGCEDGRWPRFIGSHPMTGSEKTGVENARADLYRGATVALCPLGPSRSTVRRAKDFWKRAGARTAVMPASVHDRLVAHTSHLPHVLAAGLVQVLVRLDRRDRGAARLLAGSFRDTTRISDSDPRQWAEICHANRKPLAAALRSYIEGLRQVLKKAESGRDLEAGWERFFSDAKAGRKRLLSKSPKFS